MLSGTERRILVIGNGGAGKSTMARALGAKLGLPVVHLDQEYWGAGWREPDPSAWKRRVDELTSAPEWVMDGNYRGTLERRVAASDAVLFLDLSPWVCLWRAVRRRLEYHNAVRRDMASGCPERLQLSFAHWIWTYRQRVRPGVLEVLDRAVSTTTIIHFHRAGEMKSFLKALDGPPGIGEQPGEARADRGASPARSGGRGD